MLQRSNVLAGLIFIALGGAFAIKASVDLKIGNAFRMGPGYFPLLLGGLLVALGAAIIFQKSRETLAEPRPLPVRGIVMLTLSILVFGVTIERWGLLPASALSALAATLAARGVRPAYVLCVAGGLTVFCIVIFRYGLDLPMPLFGRG